MANPRSKIPTSQRCGAARMDRWMRVLLFGVGATVALLTARRLRLSPIRFLRPIDREEGSLSTKEMKMAHALELPKTARGGFTDLSARLGALASRVAAEQ